MTLESRLNLNKKAGINVDFEIGANEEPREWFAVPQLKREELRCSKKHNKMGIETTFVSSYLLWTITAHFANKRFDASIDTVILMHKSTTPFDYLNLTLKKI